MQKKSILSLFIFIVIFSNIVFAQNEEQPKNIQSAPFSQTKFNPDISLILDFSYVYRNINNTDFKKLETPGFIHSISEEEAHRHAHGLENSKNGFNFNYGEMVFASTVDPYIDLLAIFHLSEEGFEVEEAYFSTRNFPLGFQLRVGKFLSGFGRINGQHSHSWDFVDQPVIFKAVFGGEGLNEKGTRITFLPPLPFYLMAGFEMLEGSNEKSFGRHDNFSTLSVKDTNFPYLFTGFIKTSFDADDLTILLGVSGAFGKALITEGEDKSGEVLEVIQGNSTVLGADITLKYFFDSYTYFSIQGEYIYRKIKGFVYEKDTSDVVTQSNYQTVVSGFYLQTVLKFDKQWRVGARYEILDLKGKNLPKYSTMIDYNPSEFSRLRLQYNNDQSYYLNNQQQINHEFIFQFNLAIGSHGAHSF